MPDTLRLLRASSVISKASTDYDYSHTVWEGVVVSIAEVGWCSAHPNPSGVVMIIKVYNKTLLPLFYEYLDQFLLGLDLPTILDAWILGYCPSDSLFMHAILGGKTSDHCPVLSEKGS